MVQKTWWKKAVFYEIYMPSFCDGNSDGIGDFKGITSKLDYLSDLGVRGIWLTPFYKSPKVDNGYDIEDYFEIDPDYGTMDDFKNFLKEAHNRSIHVVADMVLNHTSNMHPWFLESKSSLNNDKRNWYIWRKGNNRTPNNWQSFFSGSAWEFDKTTNEYYYHAFAKEQVDLNWSNPEVKKAMFDILRYWLDLGIDGFRLDVVNFLKTDEDFKDNPFDKDGNQEHKYDKDKQGIIGIIKELRNLVNSYGDKFLVGEVGSENLDILKNYVGEALLNVVFNFNLGSIEKLNPDRIYNEIYNMEEKLNNNLPTLFFSSHDMSRFISRFSDGNFEEERSKLIAALMLSGRGVPFIYFGDEIGMRDFHPESIDDIMDIQGISAFRKALYEGKSQKEALKIGDEASRDKSRTPMQWDDTEYSGFSEVKPWIKIPPKYKHINVLQQSNDPDSMLCYYKKLIQMRNTHKVFQCGNYKVIKMDGSILYFIREYEDEKAVCLFNFSESRQRHFITGQRELLPYEAVISVEDKFI